MVHRKKTSEIEHITASSQVVFAVQQKLEALVAPGISTRELDEIAESGLTPADRLLELYYGKWNRRVEPAFEALAY